MSKKFYIGFVTLFIIASVILGVTAFKVTEKRVGLFEGLDQLNWIIPTNSGYDGFTAEYTDESYFVGYDKAWNTYLFDQKGKVVKEGLGSPIGKGFYSYEKDGKEGIKNYQGKVIIPAKFELIETFDGEYGCGEIKGIRGNVAFDGKGKILLKESLGGFSSWQIKGPYFFRQPGSGGEVVNVDTGEVVFNDQRFYEAIPAGDKYYAGTLISEEKSFLNENFQPIFDGKIYRDIDEFNQGYCYAEQITNGTVDEVPTQAEIQSGYVDQTGNLKIKTGNSLKGFGFSEGKAIVYYKDKIRGIDIKGTTLFEIPFDSKEEKIVESVYRDNMAIVGNDNKMGLIDSEGKWLIKPAYNLRYLGGNLISINYGNKWGVVKIDS